MDNKEILLVCNCWDMVLSELLGRHGKYIE